MATDTAKRKFTPLNEQQLQDYLLHRGNSGQFQNNQVVYIKPPIKKPASAAAIWYRWNFDLSTPNCGFYFGLWFQVPEDGLNGETSEIRTNFIGYRYETPEEGNNHNYYHVQPCQSMGDRDEKVTQALPVPERNPTWPLAARSSLELLLCLVVSIYGMKGLLDMKEHFLGVLNENNNLELFGSIQNILNLQIQIKA